MFRNTLIALAVASVFATPALANMPPKQYDFPYTGEVRLCDADMKCVDAKVAMKKYPVAYTDDLAAYRECERVSQAKFGTPYLDPSEKGPLGVGHAGMPQFGCTMYDEAKMTLYVVFTFDSPKIAAKRLRTTSSKQGYDKCMRQNSYKHEEGHANAIVMGKDTHRHSGWVSFDQWLKRHPGACRYDVPSN